MNEFRYIFSVFFVGVNYFQYSCFVICWWIYSALSLFLPETWEVILGSLTLNESVSFELRSFCTVTDTFDSSMLITLVGI